MTRGNIFQLSWLVLGDTLSFPVLCESRRDIGEISKRSDEIFNSCSLLNAWKRFVLNALYIYRLFTINLFIIVICFNIK